MNPISKVSRAITGPAQAAGAVVGASIGVGLRTTARVLGWAVERATSAGPERDSPAWPEARESEAPAPEAPEVRVPPKRVPAAQAPAKKATAKKAPAKKAAARKAPSKKAAVVAPALGLTEAEVEAEVEAGTEPLLDPATAKAVASEAEVLQRAADRDLG